MGKFQVLKKEDRPQKKEIIDVVQVKNAEHRTGVGLRLGRLT